MGQLGGTVEAEGQLHGADAAIHIELHVGELEHAFDVLLTHGGKDERADERGGGSGRRGSGRRA